MFAERRVCGGVSLDHHFTGNVGFQIHPTPHTHKHTHIVHINFSPFFLVRLSSSLVRGIPLVFFFLVYHIQWDRIAKKKTYKILEYEGFFLKGVVGGRGLIYINIYSNMSTKRIHTVIRYLNKFSILCVSLSLGLTIW